MFKTKQYKIKYIYILPTFISIVFIYDGSTVYAYEANVNSFSITAKIVF